MSDKRLTKDYKAKESRQLAYMRGFFMNAKKGQEIPPMCFECGSIFNEGWVDGQWPYNGDRNRCFKCKPKESKDEINESERQQAKSEEP